jgi:hypothetical protein
MEKVNKAFILDFKIPENRSHQSLLAKYLKLEKLLTTLLKEFNLDLSKNSFPTGKKLLFIRLTQSQLVNVFFLNIEWTCDLPTEMWWFAATPRYPSFANGPIKFRQKRHYVGQLDFNRPRKKDIKRFRKEILGITF